MTQLLESRHSLQMTQLIPATQQCLQRHQDWDILSPGELVRGASSTTTSHSLSLTDPDTEEPGEVRGSSAKDEGNDNASLSSYGTLDCTSTPVAIGHDPFAVSGQTCTQHEKVPSSSTAVQPTLS